MVLTFSIICGTFHDLVPIVTFKQRENHLRKRDTFSNVSKLKPATLLKIKRFSCFLNCTTNGTETRRASHTVEYTLERLDSIIYNPLFQQRHCNIVVLEKEVRVPKKTGKFGIYSIKRHNWFVEISKDFTYLAFYLEFLSQALRKGIEPAHIFSKKEAPYCEKVNWA